jgi:hypothetical protein
MQHLIFSTLFYLFSLKKYNSRAQENDDDFGPAPRAISAPSPAFLNPTALPLGLTGATAEELQHLEGSKKGVEAGTKKRGPEEREEWMINPGEDRAIAGTVQCSTCFEIQ